MQYPQKHTSKQLATYREIPSELRNLQRQVENRAPKVDDLPAPDIAAQPADHGEGFSWRELQVRPGLWVSVVEVCEGHTVNLRYSKKQEQIEFGFLLSGGMCHQCEEHGCRGMKPLNRAGQAGLGYLPSARGSVSIPARQRVRLLHLHVELDLMREMLKYDLKRVPHHLRGIIEGKERQPVLYTGEMEAKTLCAAGELFGGVHNGQVCNVLLEGKALELIGLQMLWLSGQSAYAGGDPENFSRRGNGALSPEERRRVTLARDILVQNLESPPSLGRLCRELRLSSNKLQAGFQEIYGETVFGYLREFRMLQARQLLDEAEMNVSQVAWSIGYTNLSHFSAAFRKRFGVLPKQYLQSVRRIASPLPEKTPVS